MLWQEEKPSDPQNREIGASYRYSLPPDAAPDETAPDDTVPCQTGHLTDRRESIMARKTEARWYAPYELPASRWIVSRVATDPVAITFDQRRPWRLQQFKLWFRDSLPAVTFEGSSDGQRWTPLAAARADEAGEDVKEVVVPLRGKAPCRYVRGSFGARQAGQKLTLVEAEVWGADR